MPSVVALNSVAVNVADIAMTRTRPSRPPPCFSTRSPSHSSHSLTQTVAVASCPLLAVRFADDLYGDWHSLVCSRRALCALCTPTRLRCRSLDTSAHSTRRATHGRARLHQPLRPCATPPQTPQAQKNSSIVGVGCWELGVESQASGTGALISESESGRRYAFRRCSTCAAH